MQTDYVYWGNSLLYEITLGRAIDYVWAEGKLLAKVENSGTTYFHHDHLGSSKLQTDDSGNVVSSDVTQPFGPRICADAVKDEFTTLDRVNTAASTIAFDATNGVIKAPKVASGYQTGELYTTELKSGVAARVVKLGWTGSGVTFYVSSDGNTWSQLQKDQPLALGTSSRSLYLKAVLAADASSVLDRYLLQINPTGFNLFTGKMLTEETGLVYFGARWYDPEIGRWITVDPAEDGENWYAYCGNNPVNYKDPNGLYTGADDAAAFLGGGLISAGIEFGFQAWGRKFDITKVFTAFLKGGLSSWVGLYTGAGGIAVYSFLDAIEEGVRAKLVGHSYSFNQYTQLFVTNMISGVAGGGLGKGIAKLAGRLAIKIQPILNAFKNNFVKSNNSLKLNLQFFAESPKTKLYDIVPYRPSNPIFENHHGVMDIWATNNVPGYISRASNSPTIALTKDLHNAAAKVYRDWLFKKTGRKVGAKVDWSKVSPQEICDLSERMMNAADVPQDIRQMYYRIFYKYIYEGSWQ